MHGYGYGQDEDQGQLGAWYVMSSIGLFDVKGLVEIDPSFQFGSPLFDKVEIETGSGQSIIINTSHNGPGNYYIQSIKLNGKEYKNRQIDLDLLLSGAELDIVMGDKPNQSLYQPL